MTEPQAVPILIPLLNPNEPEAALAALHVQPGQRVTPGDLLCTLETTKSAADLHAEGEGYIAGLQAAPGQLLRAGEVLCYLAPTPNWQPPAPARAESAVPATPAGMRITQPALLLAQRHSLNLNSLPSGVLVTEKMVQELLARPTEPESPLDPAAIIVYGGGGHGKTLIDLLRALGRENIRGVVDDGIPRGEHILGVPVLGGAKILPFLRKQGIGRAVNAVGGIGNLAVRIQVFQALKQAGFECPAVVHPSAWVEPSASLAEGVQVFPHAYVGSAAQVGFGAIVNTGAIVSHDCAVGEHANLSPGAILAGEVQVGAETLVGMGVTINLRVKIGRGARIGNSATIKSDLPNGSIVRAGSIWPD
jgi:sugar O-acyltransferase (sialic acid O-acetyltransferase NeuD family)